MTLRNTRLMQHKVGAGLPAGPPMKTQISSWHSIGRGGAQAARSWAERSHHCQRSGEETRTCMHEQQAQGILHAKRAHKYQNKIRHFNGDRKNVISVFFHLSFVSILCWRCKGLSTSSMKHTHTHTHEASVRVSGGADVAVQPQHIYNIYI